MALTYYRIGHQPPNDETGPYLFATPEEYQALRIPYQKIRSMRSVKEKETGSWVGYYGYIWARENLPEAKEYNGYCRELLDAFFAIMDSNPGWISGLYALRSVEATGKNSYHFSRLDESLYIDIITQCLDCLFLVKEYTANSDVRLMPGKRYDIVVEWNDGAETMQISNLPILTRNVNMELIKLN